MADEIIASEKTKQTSRLRPQPPPAPKSYTPDSSIPQTSPAFVLQFPKEQILKMPSEEDQQKYINYTKTRPMRRHIMRTCRRCLCTAICVVVLILAIFGCVFYFAFRPKVPTYALTGLSISGFDDLLTSSVTPLNPSIIATVETENRNKRISILYQTGGSVSVYFDTVSLCKGDWPAFRQRPENLTVFETKLSGSGILLTAVNRGAMLEAENRSTVPLMVSGKVPVKIKFSFVTSWAVTVRVSCKVIVNSLTAKAAILSKKCHVKTHYLW